MLTNCRDCRGFEAPVLSLDVLLEVASLLTVEVLSSLGMYGDRYSLVWVLTDNVANLCVRLFLAVIP